MDDRVTALDEQNSTVEESYAKVKSVESEEIRNIALEKRKWLRMIKKRYSESDSSYGSDRSFESDSSYDSDRNNEVVPRTISDDTEDTAMKKSTIFKESTVPKADSKKPSSEPQLGRRHLLSERKRSLEKSMPSLIGAYKGDSKRGLETHYLELDKGKNESLARASYLEQRNKELQTSLERSRIQGASFEKKIEKLPKMLRIRQERVSKLEKEKNDLLASLKRLRIQETSLVKKNEELTKELTIRQKRELKLEEEKNDLLESLERLRAENETLKKTKELSTTEWFKTNILDDNFKMKEEYACGLQRLEWLESFKVADANMKCKELHLEIVCKQGKVPRTRDIISIFGEEILPLITYKEVSKHEWFKENILGRNSGGKKTYKKKMTGLSWVKDFRIGMVEKPEKSWQLYITCAQNQLPSMVELKTLFGVNIASFVDFVEDSNPDEKILQPPPLLRGPRSGDEICLKVQDRILHGGTLGIVSYFGRKHYAVTCYHVCFKGDLPENYHEILKDDCANQNSQGCRGAEFLYRPANDEERQLGKFCYGLYDDDHDIALVEMEKGLHCTEAVNFIAKNQIETELADINQVEDIYEEMFPKKVPVEKFGAVTGKTKGELALIDKYGGIQTEETSYKITGIDDQEFAKKGDSGSLVYLIHNGKRVPFAYVCAGKEDIFCRNLLKSIRKLRHDIQPCLKPH